MDQVAKLICSIVVWPPGLDLSSSSRCRSRRRITRAPKSALSPFDGPRPSSNIGGGAFRFAPRGQPRTLVKVRAQVRFNSSSISIAVRFSSRVLVRSCIACRFIQNSRLVPQKQTSRNAVSAVTDRSPLTMAAIHVARDAQGEAPSDFFVCCCVSCQIGSDVRSCWSSPRASFQGQPVAAKLAFPAELSPDQ
jgi:hypothetical protein